MTTKKRIPKSLIPAEIKAVELQEVLAAFNRCQPRRPSLDAAFRNESPAQRKKDVLARKKHILKSLSDLAKALKIDAGRQPGKEVQARLRNNQFDFVESLQRTLRGGNTGAGLWMMGVMHAEYMAKSAASAAERGELQLADDCLNYAYFNLGAAAGAATALAEFDTLLRPLSPTEVRRVNEQRAVNAGKASVANKEVLNKELTELFRQQYLNRDKTRYPYKENFAEIFLRQLMSDPVQGTRYTIKTGSRKGKPILGVKALHSRIDKEGNLR